MRTRKVISPNMIRRALIHKTPLRVPVDGVTLCRPHQKQSDPFAGQCRIKRKGKTVKALILDPRGVLQVDNPLLYCRERRSKTFYALGGTAKTQCSFGGSAVRPYVDIPAWNGISKVRSPVLAQNKTCGVTLQLMRWVTNLAFSTPENWNPSFVESVHRFSTLFQHSFTSHSLIFHTYFSTLSSIDYTGGWFKILTHHYAEMINAEYPMYKSITWREVKSWLNLQEGIDCHHLGRKMWETLNHTVFKPMWGMCTYLFQHCNITISAMFHLCHTIHIKFRHYAGDQSYGGQQELQCGLLL